MKLIAQPETILIASRMRIIFIVSLKSLFFKSTKSPSPAFVSSPLIAVPNVIVPLMSIIVNPIDIAQFGISPINAAAIVGRNLLPPM